MLIATFGGRAALHLPQTEYGARVTRTAKLLRHWLPVLGWMLLISIASTDLMSAEHTSRFIGPFLRLCFPDISPATVATVQIGLRKAAHLAEYAVLALLLRRALVLPAGRVQWGLACGIVVVCFCYASLDEFHQSFVASRTGAAADVLIDTIGALFGLAGYELVAMASRRRLHSERLRS